MNTMSNDEIAEQNREMAICIFKSRITTYLNRRRELEQARRDLEAIKQNEQTELRALMSFGIPGIEEGVAREYKSQRYFAESLLRDRERYFASITEEMEEACDLMEEAGLDATAAWKLLNA
ncbi:MAG: hypothetical protein Q3986_07415 [Akkermansia sp.]|nr:hypothetical protein [Akkermansia sp.]